MNDTMLFTTAIIVFTLMVVGLGLTILEFRLGQPAREQEEPGHGKGSVKPSHAPQSLIDASG